MVTRNEWKKKFAYRIINRMIELNINSRELSKKTNIPESTISKYLSANRVPGAYYAAIIAKALGVTVDYLIGSV